MNELYYGVAYYLEYMPEDRLEKDIALMKEANINLVRISESTWSSHEPEEGIFDFDITLRVLDAMYEAGISVIVGTPTYAIPAWLAKKHPEVMVTTKQGQQAYGARQIMDITHPTYLYYAERVIQKLISTTVDHPAVIGFQIDNENKHYDTSSDNVQKSFVKYLKAKFNSNINEMNAAFGLTYWSNRVNAWEDFPSVVGTINGSLGAEFSKYQRSLVNHFIEWQANIIKEYKKEHHFLTHNFDFEWRDYSFGIQPNVNHFEASKYVDVTGVDVYHPSQDDLTGIEISFAGDIARTTKNKNYFVLETEAQGFKQWTPYPGQLRLQAFSHIASGASMVEYWHWHSIHNSFETYWKGLLSHDLKPNPVYNEAKLIGKEFSVLKNELKMLRKHNDVAFVVSNESLTAVDDWFNFSGSQQVPEEGASKYNDVFRQYYDELYKLNVETDILSIGDKRIKDYKLLIIPLLYSANDAELEMLNQFVKNGGHIIYTFKSGYSDENLQVRNVTQPGIIDQACGISYQLITEPNNIGLTSEVLDLDDTNEISDWMELLVPTTATVIARYRHNHWGEYAAITHNKFGAGTATYVGCYTDNKTVKEVINFVLDIIGLEKPKYEFPIITKRTINSEGSEIVFYLNFSDAEQTINIPKKAEVLLSKNKVSADNEVTLLPWDLIIIKNSVSNVF